MTNPFSSRFVRPGALPFLFERGGAGELVERVASGGRHAVVGPHGTGKSTLLWALREELLRRGFGVRHEILGDGGQRRLREEVPGARGLVVLLDGFEQLGWLARIQARRAAAHALVVTTHLPPLGLPILLQTGMNPALAQRVVERLLVERQALVDPSEVQGPLAAHGGNLREALLALYALHETRARQGQQPLRTSCGRSAARCWR